MVLLIDNYDSFSYNLYQLVGSIDPDIRVIRNDEYTIEEIRAMKAGHILLSPGPGRPQSAGVCMDVVRELGGEAPILGVCLGHQAIFEAYGGCVSYAKELMHGKQSVITVDNDSLLFHGMPSGILAARYHSLAGIRETIPDKLRICARTEDGEIMAVEDLKKQVYGVQFHPESILTPEGKKIIENFLSVR